MSLLERTYKKNIASGSLWQQIWGALAKHWWLMLLFVLFFVLTIISFCPPCHSSACDVCLWCKLIKAEPGNKVIWLICLTSFLFLVFGVCNTLTEINSLLRKEDRITWSQIAKLIALGIWMVGFVLIFDVRNNVKVAAAVGIIGVVLGWIFQDRVKGVAAFIALRRHHQLNIGDWIKVPNLDVDGEVKKVTLTTVTLSNWDTTTSNIPISALQQGHFINLQNMSEGKTYGRKMLKTFTLDTGWIRPITEEDVESYKTCEHDILDYLPKEELVPGALNAHLYRLYLYHWLMNNPHISQYPRLIVRWMDQKESGLTLQVYAFVTERNFTAFEWEQSQIMEHIISSLEWFGLRLYQTPSAYDVSNSNIHLTDQPATYGKEDKQ